MKRLCYLLMLLPGIISCDADNRGSKAKEVAGPPAKKDSASLGLQLLSLASSTIVTIQAAGDSLRSASTPEKALTLVNCNDALVEFRDSTMAASQYNVKVKIELTTSDKHSDSVNFRPAIKSFSIAVNQMDFAIPERFLPEFENLVPCDFKVFESRNKRNLLIYPHGFYREKPEKITINLDKQRIAKVNNTTIVY